jgi:hypothetical protein
VGFGAGGAGRAGDARAARQCGRPHPPRHQGRMPRANQACAHSGIKGVAGGRPGPCSRPTLVGCPPAGSFLNGVDVKEGPPFAASIERGSPVGTQWGLMGCDPMSGGVVPACTGREVVTRIRPRLHIFGHVHEAHGRPIPYNTTSISVLQPSGSRDPSGHCHGLQASTGRRWPTARPCSSTPPPHPAPGPSTPPSSSTCPSIPKDPSRSEEEH